MQDNKDVLKKKIIALQSGRSLFCNGGEVIDEIGNQVDEPDCTELKWDDSISALTLGRCGELYAQYILKCFGYETFEALVDDHGIDLLAQKSERLKVQVKTIRNRNYTFIREGNPQIDDTFFLIYIYVTDEGRPQAYFFPMNYIVNEMKKGNVAKYCCFTHRQYVDKISPSEYGISAAKKYFNYREKNNMDLKTDETRFYKIADGWETYADRIKIIIEMNKR